MSSLPKTIGLPRWPILLGLAITLTAGAAAARDEATAWHIVLTDQVKKAKGCDLRQILSENEMKLGDEIVIEGRLACVDGREFTFTRRRPHQPFQFELCEPTVC